MSPEKAPPASPVRATIHLLVFVALVLGTLTAATWGYSQEKRVFRETLQKELDDLTALKINQLMAWQAERKGDGLVAAYSASMMPEVELALAGRPEAQTRAVQWMENIRQSYRYAGAELLDPAGNVRLAIGPSPADAEFFRALEREATTPDQIVFRYFPKGGNVLKSTFALCTPLRNASGVMVGSLVLNVDPWIYPFPDVIKWPSATRSGRLFIVRREGNRARAIGFDSAANNAAPLEVLTDLSQRNSPFAQAVYVRDGAIEGFDNAGHQVVGAVRGLPVLPNQVRKVDAAPGETAMMVALLDQNEAYQPLRQSRLLLVLASGLMIALSGAGVGWIWRQQVLQSYRQQLDAEQERRALIGHYDYLTRFANDAVFLANSNGEVVQVNERASDFYGYPRDEMLGMDVHAFRAPGTEEHYSRSQESIDKQKSVLFESEAVRKDGSVFPVELSVRVMDVNGALYRQTIVRDITERRKSQQQIERLNRLYAVLSRCGQAVVRAQDETALFHEVVNVAVTSGNFCIAAIAVIDSASGRLATAAQAGASAGYLAAVCSAGDSITSGVAGRSVPESGAWVCNDLWQDENSAAIVEAAHKYKVRSLLRLLLWRGGRPAGELRLCSSEPGFFNQEETELAAEVAQNLCFALESLDRKRRQENIEAELRKNRELLELVLDATEEAYWDWELKTDTVHQSPRYDLMLGYGPNEVPRGYHEWHALMHPQDASRVNKQFSDFVQSGNDIYSNEFRMRRKSGEFIWVSCRSKVVRRDSDGSPARMVGTFTDVTDRKRLEEQFRQAQKLESVGRLAGGVAHDFNNLLTVINGYSSLLMRRFPSDDPRLKQLSEIRKAGERAADLTKQLLTFSRKNVSEPRLLNLNSAAAECETMLRRLIPDSLVFTSLYEARQDEVVIDPGQLQQVLMNLVVNACDAMTTGGRLTIRTANVEVAEADLAEGPSEPGRRWVLLEVGDTGVGMDEDTVRQIFEPFFTTKDVGKGTGLGLSTVYGIVRQCAGFIRVESSPGAGTTFRIHFPVAAQGILPRAPKQIEDPGITAGSETVLVVEDQGTVLEYAVDTLRSCGYSVFAARGGAAALDMAKHHTGPIDLLLTDVVMPAMGGRALAEELLLSRPSTKVIYMSGYDETAGRAGANGASAEYLEKPFSPEALAAKVRWVLNKPAVSRTILVVEDEAAVRDVFVEFLGTKHKLLLASDGEEAMSLLRSGHNPDLVITDMVMPKQAGIGLIREIRRSLPKTKIVAMSGAFGGRFLETAGLLGADATLVKPIRPEVLDQAIEDVLSGVPVKTV